jgi:ribosomal protein S12 methylthiotransferase
MKVNIINIGCFKNLVDCEYLIWQLQDCGVEVVFGEKEGKFDVAILNTCGFISDAESDSKALIRRYIQRKIDSEIGCIWIMGCYGQKMGEKIIQEMPEVDHVYGNFDWHHIVNDLCGGVWKTRSDRCLVTPSHYSYIKISEGCNMRCSYCVKPQLNGPMQSRKIEDIVNECRKLAINGVKELQIVAQITTSYGEDIYGENRIVELINRIADIQGIEWIRLHYAYPGGFPMKLLEVIKNRPNVCKYLDMAIQHCNGDILKRMRRPSNRVRLEALIKEIREAVPDITLRTTVMTGFPGESEDNFEELKQFIISQHFERLGVFPYSHEANSYSGIHYKDDVPLTIKRKRAYELIELQKKIYKEDNAKLIGKPLKVIVDSINDDGSYWARPESSTPMADPKVKVITDNTLQIGSFINVLPTKVYGKDFEAIV